MEISKTEKKGMSKQQWLNKPFCFYIEDTLTLLIFYLFTKDGLFHGSTQLFTLYIHVGGEHDGESR
jgi:hypothetical protein